MNDKNKEFDGRVAIVTGAGRGIGRNIAQMLAERGAAVALCDIDRDSGAKIASEITTNGRAAEYFFADLSLEGEPKRLVKDVFSKFGRIDIVVNNARAGKRATFAEESEDNWDTAMAVNVKAIFFLAQAALPLMEVNGAFVNIGSISSEFVSRESASYQVSKAGLLHLTRLLAVEGGRRSIRANMVQPGFIVQDEHRGRFNGIDNGTYRSLAEDMHPLRGGPGTSDDIARAVMFLASNEASFITGQTLVVDGGLSVQEQATLLLSRVPT